MAGEEGDGAGGGGAANKEAEEKDLELDLMAEQELLRLTRQYRVTKLRTLETALVLVNEIIMVIN